MPSTPQGLWNRTRTKVLHSFNSRIQPRLDAVDTSMEIETEEEKDLTLTAGNLLL